MAEPPGVFGVLPQQAAADEEEAEADWDTTRWKANEDLTRFLRADDFLRNQLGLSYAAIGVMHSCIELRARRYQQDSSHLASSQNLTSATADDNVAARHFFIVHDAAGAGKYRINAPGELVENWDELQLGSPELLDVIASELHRQKAFVQGWSILRGCCSL